MENSDILEVKKLSKEDEDRELQEAKRKLEIDASIKEEAVKQQYEKTQTTKELKEPYSGLEVTKEPNYSDVKVTKEQDDNSEQKVFEPSVSPSKVEPNNAMENELNFSNISRDERDELLGMELGEPKEKVSPFINRNDGKDVEIDILTKDNIMLAVKALIAVIIILIIAKYFVSILFGKSSYYTLNDLKSSTIKKEISIEKLKKENTKIKKKIYDYEELLK